MFAIRFLENASDDQPFGEPGIYGEIQINSYSESFFSPTTYWSPQDYEEHWLQGIKRIISGMNSSCLITSVYNPRDTEFIQWWLLYRLEKAVFVQNQALFLSEIQGVFNPSDPFKYIPEREIYTEDNERISEWEITLNDLDKFLEKQV